MPHASQGFIVCKSVKKSIVIFKPHGITTLNIKSPLNENFEIFIAQEFVKLNQNIGSTVFVLKNGCVSLLTFL